MKVIAKIAAVAITITAVSAAAGWFDVSTYLFETSGGGANLHIQLVPDDLESGDSMSMVGIFV